MTPPTAGSWLHSYELLTLGPGAIRRCRGEEKPKGTEQIESLQEDGAAEVDAMTYRGDLALRCSPGAIARSMRGFSCGFSHLV